jgi:hypothetical protein
VEGRKWGSKWDGRVEVIDDWWDWVGWGAGKTGQGDFKEFLSERERESVREKVSRVYIIQGLAGLRWETRDERWKKQGTTIGWKETGERERRSTLGRRRPCVFRETESG